MLGLNTITLISSRVGSFIKRIVTDGLKMRLPFTSAEPLGENLVVNGDFSDGTTGWQSSGSDWTFSNNSAVYVGDGSASELLQNINFVGGKLYKIVIDVASISGTLKVRFNNDQANKVTFNTVGENIIYITTSGTGLINNDISISRESGVVNSVINSVSVEEYAQETLDTSNSGNNAILKTGKCLEFDGNDYINIDGFNVDTNEATFAFWAKPADNASSSSDMIIDLGAGNRFFISVASNRWKIYQYASGASSFDVHDPKWKVIPNNWQRVVVSIDKDNYVSVYSNGVLLSDPRLLPNPLNLNGKTNGTIGANYDNSNNFYTGYLSDIQVYDKAWGSDDVTYDYKNPQNLVTDNLPTDIHLRNLKAWWHLSEGSGSVIHDSAPLIGDELVANGDFSDGENNWNFESKWSLSNGGARLQSNDSSGSALVQYSVFEVGKTYKITFDADVSFGVAKFYGGTGDSLITISETKNYSLTFVADFTNLVFQRVSNSSDLTIDNVSVKEVFNIDGETYDGSSLGATYDDAQERIPQLGMMNWSKGSNVLANSNDFGANPWNTQSGSVSLVSGYEAPDGTLTAWKVSRTGGTGTGILYNGTVTANIGVVRSIWAKTVNGTGTVHLTSQNGNINSLFTVTNEWQRFSATSGSAVAGNFYAVDFRDTNGTLTEVIIWGAQEEVNVGDSLSAFRKTNGTAVTDATLISCATDSQKDILGNAVRVKGGGFNLDGTGYAEVLDDITLDIPACNNVDEGGFTLSAWVKSKYVSKSSSINVVSTLGGDVTQPETGGIVVFDTNKFGAYINAALLQADNTFIEGNWYNVVITRSVSGNCKLYVDTNAQIDTDYTLDSITNSNNKMVGRDSLPYQRFYEERIDDVKFYNRELSLTEIEQNFNATKSAHTN